MEFLWLPTWFSIVVLHKDVDHEWQDERLVDQFDDRLQDLCARGVLDYLIQRCRLGYDGIVEEGAYVFQWCCRTEDLLCFEIGLGDVGRRNLP